MKDQDIVLDIDSLFGFSQFDKVGDSSQDITELHSKSDEIKGPLFASGDCSEAEESPVSETA